MGINTETSYNKFLYFDIKYNNYNNYEISKGTKLKSTNQI